MNHIKILSFVLLVFILVSGCQTRAAKNQPQIVTNPYKKTDFLMGTIVTVKVYDEGKEEVLEPVFNRIRELAGQITVDEIESEIVNINTNAGIKPVKVSADIFKLVEVGKLLSEEAEGSFDISIGPLTSLWHIGFPDAKKPDQQEINAVLPYIDYKQILLNHEQQTIFLKKQGMQLDLGAIAKGFITDEVCKILNEYGVTTAIIDLGGNIYVLGKSPSQKPWSVGIQDPFSARGETIGKLAETNKSIVTSGIYERFIQVGETKYHHLLDPRDGYPFMNDLAGVSIISDKSVDGDALSTLVFSKGLKDGMKYIESTTNVDAIFITTNKKVYVSSGIKQNFELTNIRFTLADL